MQAHKVIVGQSPWLEQASEDWLLVYPDLSLTLIELKLNRSHCFDLSSLDQYDPEFSTGFVAWGPQFLNYQRMELMGEFKKRGFKMPALVHPSAQVSASANYQENVWIQAQAVIGPHVSLGLNSHVGIGARLGVKSQLGNHAWLGQDVRLGAGAKVGPNAVLGDEVIVGDTVIIGRQACIEKPCVILKNWSEKAFYLSSGCLQGSIICYAS